MKTPPPTVYLGQPLDEPSERAFLERLRADLPSRGIPTLILANFTTRSRFRQVDFLIATPDRAVHCELKAYAYPVIGTVNGPWTQLLPDGRTRVLDEENPFRQAQTTTYAISDDMRSLAAMDPTIPGVTDGRFFKHIDAVVCLFPSIPAGSRFERFAFVTVLGYEELLRRLSTPGPRPPWNGEQWKSFIRALGVYKEEARSAQDRALVAARQATEDYRRRFVTAQSADLHEIVPVAATIEGSIQTRPDLLPLVLDRRSVLVTGQSGLGKSHIARHAAVQMAEGGHVPVWIRAHEYRAGGFGTLVSRAIAPYTNEALADFLQMARQAGRVVAIILDGFNECPATARQELLEEISGFVLAHDVHVVITTQTAPDLPEPLTPLEVILGMPDQTEREALVSSYGAGGELAAITAFTTPFELSLAAQCAMALKGRPTRAELMEEYLARRTESEATRSALRLIARAMNDDVRISLPVATVRRMLQREHVPADVIDATFACPLLVVRQGTLAFSHELFGRFLTAMDLVIRTRTGAELGRLLKAPQHADLRADAISLEHEAERLRDALHELCDASTLYDALCGDLGPTQQSVALSEATGLLAEASERTCLERVSPAPTFDDLFGERWIPDLPWSPFEVALLTAIGSALTRDILINEVAHVLDRTDELIEALVHQLSAAGERAPITKTIAAIYGVGQTHAGTALAASCIVLACDRHRPNFRRHPRTDRGAGAAAAFFSGSQARSWSRFHAALLVVDPCDASNTAMLPDLITAAWNAAGYHLLLQALDTARFAASYLDEADSSRVVAALEGLNTANLGIGLSTSLVDALAAYGALEPMNDLEGIRAEIASVLSRPDEPAAWKEAHTIVMRQLEEAEVFGNYDEGLAELGPADRGMIALMAARGADRDGWFTHFVIQQLLHHASLDDRAVQEVLVGFAAELPVEVPQQASLSVHLDALVACAGFLERAPEVGDPADRRPDLEAWRVLRDLVFGIARHEPPSLMTTMLWGRVHEELAEGCVDVLFHMYHAAMLRDPSRETAHSLMIATYPDQVRALLEWGLLHRDELTSLFRFDNRADRDQYMVRTLGFVGNQGTARMLRTLLTDAGLGAAAFDAIRRLEVAIHATG